MSVIEPHGLYDLTREVTAGFESNVTNIVLLKDNEDFTATKIEKKNGHKFIFITVNKDFGELKNRIVKLNDSTISFTGNYYFSEIKN